jgi:hypothetical protein
LVALDLVADREAQMVEAASSLDGKSPCCLPNFCESLFFFSELKNQVNHLPKLLKPFVYLPNWLQAVFKGGFVFFFFIYFG